MNSKLIVGIVLALVAIAGTFLLFGNQQQPVDVVQPTVAVTEPTVTEPTVTEPATTAAVEPPKNIVLAQADAKETTTASPAVAAPSGRFKLGQHYERLSPTQPTSSSPDQVEVAEIFWYGCNHCYDFDPYLENWLNSKPDGVSFVRVPAVWNPLVKLHGRAFYTAQALGKGDEMHAAFFREIHVNRNTLGSEQALREFFGRFGVSSEEFKNAFDSLGVFTKMQRAEKLAERYRVSSVPMIVVNGKYTTSGSSAGGYDALMDVIDELIVLEKADAS